jgi:MFS family permease
MDEILESTGKFGKFQYKVLVIIGFVSALSSACMYATIFVAAEPELLCSKKNSKSINDSMQNHTIHSVYTPVDSNIVCDIWSNMSQTQKLRKIKELNEFKCHYDETYYGSTIINDWNLICNRHYLAGLTQTVHIFGSIFGFCGGVFGDKYGRKRASFWFATMLTFTLLISQLLQIDFFVLRIEVRYLIYTIGQFLIGLLVNCLYCTAYVLLMEFTTEKYRTYVANLNSYFYVLGELIVLFAYYINRNWHFLNWFIGVYSLILVFLISFLPESPAWLISSKRFSEASAILKSIAKVNGNKNYIVPNLIKNTIDDLDDSYTQRQHQQQQQHQEYQQQQHESLLNKKSTDMATVADSSMYTKHSVHSKELDGMLVTDYNPHHLYKRNQIHYNSFESIDIKRDSYDLDILMLKNLFVPKSNFIKTSLCFYIWAALMLLYYGISLGVTSVGLTNPYLMYFLSSIAELIGYIFCYVNDLFGRKKTISGFFLVTTLVYFLLALFSTSTNGPNESYKTYFLMLLALIGKCSVSGSYNIAYIFTSELYSVTTRNTAVLFLTCVGGASSLVSPQINTLNRLVWAPLPYIIYSICSMLACLCVWFLPETKKI